MAKLEAEAIYEKKYSRRVVIPGSGDRKSYKIYIPRENSPILNSLQSFSLTSPRIYRQCQPWLWRKLQFPTSLPAQMSLWTEHILPRQGTHVHSLSVGFSPMRGGSPYNEYTENDPFYDNRTLDFAYDRKELISAKNAKLLIERCPNISALTILCGYVDNDLGRTESSLLDVVSMLSSLQQFRHLKVIAGGFQIKLMNEFALKAVSSLPLLETLMCGGAKAPGNQQKLGYGSFGLSLSKLKSLSRLHLYQFEDMNDKWRLFNWPKTLTHLTLQQCGALLPSSVCQIIPHIAPHLTYLELDLAYEKFDDAWHVDQSWDPQSSLILPFLTNLKLSTRNAFLLLNFRDCKSLRYLQWTYRTLTHCQSLNEILFKAYWPHLGKIDIAPCFYLHPLHEFGSTAYEDQLATLEKNCKQASIEVTIHSRPLVEIQILE
ncbi:uncharacterized protein MELLADRAFT_104805 [Melampsora larici-populina 98AG31]|uniref:F-box domain-containing protein n=1 Tax=Melampsora larici-populina (strain 98AG31 / pathotype 3-4-7) TaxID=747676 RepID=F4RG86_MELLP|nr:uncharacterized protein MELLADRAFT_104805 [Melampsora larici-populina 98AG31]EGG08434.1 hypothetical protein MELLADRAFT_104805 [Melampsora larici-populina 98AG31]